MFRNKKLYNILFPVVIAAVCTGCKTGSESVKPEDKPSVSVTTATTQNLEEYLTYSGYVAADEQKKYSFELGGTIKKLYVEKGDAVKSGQTLAELDTTTMQLAVNKAQEDIRLAQNAIAQYDDGINTAQIALNAEKLTLEKAKTAIDAENLSLKKIQDSYTSGINEIQLKYDNARQTFDDTSQMYTNGIVSKNDYDSAKLAFDVVSEELTKTKTDFDNDVELENKKIETMEQNYSLQEQSVAAKEAEIKSLNTKKQSAQINLNQANIALEQNQKYIKDSVLKADMDGYVMELTLKEGEVTAAGTPVVIVKSIDQVVNVGIPVDDYAKLSVGMSAQLSDDNQKTTGSIEKIELYPDEKTRTYNVKIAYSDADFAIGSLITVKIPMSQKEVFVVPISAVQNIDGVDYVYYVDEQDGKEVAKLQTVTLGEVSGSGIEVRGIQSGMKIINDGIKNITENQEVSVIGE